MDKEKIENVLKKLTLKEKIDLLSIKQFSSFGQAPRVGLPGMMGGDSACGFTGGTGEHLPDTPAYPVTIALAATWDRDMIYEVGQSTGRDAKQNKVLHIARPDINIIRSPLGGRTFECVSEDPFLTGEMGAAYVNGMKSEGISSAIKHYVANSQEYERATTNAVIDERTLREIYLRGFQLLLKKSDPGFVCTSVNRVNGQFPGTDPFLMKQVLLGEFGFKGIIFPDVPNLHEYKIRAHREGLTVEVGCSPLHDAVLYDALSQGQISEEIIDERVREIIESELTLLEIHSEPYTADFEEGHAIAKKACIAASVLLRNEENILPFDFTGKTAAVIGAYAKEPCFSGTGSGKQYGYRTDNPYEEICKIAQEKGTILYSPGYLIHDETAEDAYAVEDNLIKEAVDTAACADCVFLFLGLNHYAESEGTDRYNLSMPDSHNKLLEEIAAVNKNIILIVNAGTAVKLDRASVLCKAILQVWLGGEAMGSAIADMITGEAEPGGRLPLTIPCREEDMPSYTSMPNYPNVATQDVVYGERFYVGYRWYDKRKIKVQYPFGFGLGYTKFAFSDLQLSADEIGAGDELTVCVTVENTGTRAGKEVVQIYVADDACSADRPVKELKGFASVWLEAGEKKTVEIRLDRVAFEFFSESQKKWVIEDGSFTIMAGRSAEEILLCSKVYVHSKEKGFRYNSHTPIMHFIYNKKFHEIIKDKPQEVRDHFDPSVNRNVMVGSAFPIVGYVGGIGGITGDFFTYEEIMEICRKLNEEDDA